MSGKWFPAIESREDAAKMCKHGAIAVLVFALMNLIGVLLVVYGNTSPVDGQSVTPEDVQNNIIGAAIVLPVLLIFSWRIYRGKGWLVGGLTFVWFLAEIAAKVMGGTTNIGWLIAYVGICVLLVNSVRACWWFRSAKDDEETGIVI